MRTFNNIVEIMETAIANGSHFFDRDTLKYFDSKIYPEVINGCYFVTSKRFSTANFQDKRKYTLRVILENGKIETVGTFNDCKSKKQAAKIVNDLPKFFPDALQCAMESFNSGSQKFIDSCLIEPSKHVDLLIPKYDPETFCGACTWLVLNGEHYGFTFMRHYTAEFYKRLQRG